VKALFMAWRAGNSGVDDDSAVALISLLEGIPI